MIRKLPETKIVAYATKGKADALSVPANTQLWLFGVRAYNRSGGSQNVGICRKLNTSFWSLYSYVSSVYANVTTSIASGTNIFSGSNNDGFAVQCVRPFSLVGLTVSAQQAGGTFTYKYWNGSAFTTLTTLEVPAYSSAADIWIVFVPPSDWAPGGGGALNSSQYTLQVVSTTAPAGAVAINAIWMGEFLEFYTGVADKSAVVISFPDSKPFVLNAVESLFPYFSVPNAANAMGAFFVGV